MTATHAKACLPLTTLGVATGRPTSGNTISSTHSSSANGHRKKEIPEGLIASPGTDAKRLLRTWEGSPRRLWVSLPHGRGEAGPTAMAAAGSRVGWQDPLGLKCLGRLMDGNGVHAIEVGC